MFDFLGWRTCEACKAFFRHNEGPHLLVPEDAIAPLMSYDFGGALSVPAGEAGALALVKEPS